MIFGHKIINLFHQHKWSYYLWLHILPSDWSKSIEFLKNQNIYLISYFLCYCICHMIDIIYPSHLLFICKIKFVHKLLFTLFILFHRILHTEIFCVNPQDKIKSTVLLDMLWVLRKGVDRRPILDSNSCWTGSFLHLSWRHPFHLKRRSTSFFWAHCATKKPLTSHVSAVYKVYTN